MTDLSSYRNTALAALHLFGLLGFDVVKVTTLSQSLGLSQHHTTSLLWSLGEEGLISDGAIAIINGAWSIDLDGVEFGHLERGMSHLAIIRQGGAVR